MSTQQMRYGNGGAVGRRLTGADEVAKAMPMAPAPTPKAAMPMASPSPMSRATVIPNGSQTMGLMSKGASLEHLKDALYALRPAERRRDALIRDTSMARIRSKDEIADEARSVRMRRLEGKDARYARQGQREMRGDRFGKALGAARGVDPIAAGLDRALHLAAGIKHDGMVSAAKQRDTERALAHHRAQHQLNYSAYARTSGELAASRRREADAVARGRRAAALIGGGGVTASAGAYGLGRAHGRRAQRFGKAVSDPEAQRQRRLGAAASVTTLGGAAATHAGVRGVRRDTHGAQGYRQNTERFKNVGPQGRKVMESLGAGRKGVKAVVLSRGNAAKLLLGAGGVGGGVGIARHARKNEQWY